MTDLEVFLLPPRGFLVFFFSPQKQRRSLAAEGNDET